MKKSVLFLSFLLFIITGIVLYFIAQFLYSHKEEDLKNLLLEKVRTAVYVAETNINENIDESDDMGLLITTQMLAKTENLISVFVLDKNKNPLMRGNFADLPLDADLYVKAVNSRSELIQNTTAPNSVLMSIPIHKENTLFCLISIDKAVEEAQKWRIFCFAVGLAIDFLLVFVFYILSKVFIVFPFNRKSNALKKAKSEIENITADADDIEDKNKKNIERITLLEVENKNLAQTLKLLSDAFSKNPSIFILLDKSNNIVSAFDKTGAILKENFKISDSIAVVAKDATILKLIEKSAKKPFLKIESKSNVVDLLLISMPSKDNLFFTAIIGKN